MLNISGLKEGIVIDHIQPGGAMKIYEYLNLEKMDCQVAIIKNAKSNKMGKKDIIKIEGNLNIDLNVLGRRYYQSYFVICRHMCHAPS